TTQDSTNPKSASGGHTTQPKTGPESRHLVISPSTINLSGIGTQCAKFTITASDGARIVTPPTFTSTAVAFATAGDWLNSNQGLSWPATVCKIALTNGSGTITVSARDFTNTVITGTFTVNVPFMPYFTATQGSVTQVSSNNGY